MYIIEKNKNEALITLKDLGLSVCEVSRFQFPAEERTRAGEFLPVRYALHKYAFFAIILNNSDDSYFKVFIQPIQVNTR